MTTRQRLRRGVVRQFHNPTGVGGNLAGWIMSHRASNIARNRWAVEQLEIRPDERVLELGCGPGVALAALARRAIEGLVVGVDHSPVMIRHAQRRNAAAIAAGRICLVRATVEELTHPDEHDTPPPDRTEPLLDAPFDAVLAINNVGMWSEPEACLAGLRHLLRPGGRIALVSQPRCPGATATTSMAAATELAGLLAQAGFGGIESATLELDPPAVCVQATNPNGAPRDQQPGSHRPADSGADAHAVEPDESR